ncbi:hypothetical protein J7L05_04940 [bacterium]|nr:hypothetical protein [bacterium]
MTLTGTTAFAVVTTDELLYEPSEQFLDDFFLSLTTGNYVYPETEDAALVLRRLYRISECVQNNDYITAWQTLVNLPEHEHFPVISEIRNEARAIQSITPWFSDRELKSNFIMAYDEIWLKYNDIQDDYKKFEDVFSGYSSRSDKDNPATFIRNHLGYYGYNKTSSQPSSDIEYIWDLFRNFSLYADASSKQDFDYRTSDPQEYGKSFMKKTATRIIDAWDEALIAEKIRTGEETILNHDESASLIAENKIEPETKPVQRIDYSRINIFKLPDNAEPAWHETEINNEPEFTPVDSVVEIPDEPEIEVDTNPITNGEGLEPPEPITERRFPKVVDVPVVDPENEIVIEDVPILDEDEPVEIEEPIVDEKPVESVFVSPDVIVVDNAEDENIPEGIVTIPQVGSEIEEPVELLKEDIPVEVEMDSLDEILTPVNLLQDESDELEEITPQPVEEFEMTDEQELEEIAQRLTNRLYDVAEDLGGHAVDLVVLWSTDPDKLENYDEKESELENSFRIHKEEFLALLYLNDAFRLEENLGTTYDALNGKIIDSLMKGLKDFKAGGGLADNPNVDEEELLRAIGQLTQGVEARRESLKIQSASLKAFKLRKSQLEDDIKRLKQLKNIEISD